MILDDLETQKNKIDTAKYKTKELFVRKKIANFIEKVIHYFGNDMRHDTYKAVVYGEIEPVTATEETIKNYYDAYMYLLSNCKTPVSQTLLKKFFFILKSEVADESFLTRLSSYIFHSLEEPLIKKLINIPIFIYEELTGYDECERTMIPLMFFNYFLVRGGIPTIPFLTADIEEYAKLRNKKDIDGLEKFVLKFIEKAKFQEKDYYDNLKQLDVVDVQKKFLEDKEVLINNYHIKHIYVYGSFGKEIERIDSDIDVVCDFSYDLTYQEKLEVAEKLSKHYFKVFNRYIDIHESGTYVNDFLIKTVQKYVKIY